MLERAFRGVLAARWAIVAAGAAVLVISIALALRVPSNGAIDQLIVEDDPDHLATRAFGEHFPDGDTVVLVIESGDPYATASLAMVEAVERAVATVAGAEPFSPVALYRSIRPGGSVAEPAEAEALRAFVTGTDLLRRQGLAGDRFLAIAIGVPGSVPAARDSVLAAIDAAIAPIEASAPAGATLRRVGRPYVETWLEGATARASVRYFPLFGAFLVGLILFLYRSKRALAAFVGTLATSVAATVGLAALTGWSFSIVSSLVPLTVLVTATATLVYIHSRFVDCPEGADPGEHHVRALSNKFLPCTASVFAAAVGFAALAISEIRPIREMGLWTASGLGITWLAAFTLFPALQRILNTPTQRHREVAGRFFPRFVDRVVPWSYRWRVPLVAASLVLMAAGAAALLGIPGAITPMPLETDALDYVDPDLALARDTRAYERAVVGLTVAEAWITTPDGEALSPEVLRGVERFARILEADPRVGSATGPTTALRWARYAARGDDTLPDDPASWTQLASDLEQMVLVQPALRRFVDVATLSDLRVTLRAQGPEFAGPEGLRSFVASAFREAAAEAPAMSGCTLRVVGQGLLQTKIAQYLVPTLVESFALTAGIIFVAFLFVFRSASGRLLAMIPSLFAILAMFLTMRIVSIPLNVATILIASTVLGASENDQIHFFHHLQERRRNGSTEDALRHALLVAGRAVLFATVINAGGFLALALSDLPPMRQFGIVSSAAFVLAMVADFTALPAALWLLFGGRPGDASGSATLRPADTDRPQDSASTPGTPGGTPSARGAPVSR